MTKRKIFYYQNDKDKPICACGIILKNKDNFILQKEFYNNIIYLGDFGGKVDIMDTCYNDTIIREFIEETNGYLYNNLHNKINNLKNYLPFHNKILSKNIKELYIKNSKYLLNIVEINDFIFNKIKNLNEKYLETTCNDVYHQIYITNKKNLNQDVIKNIYLHPRLKNKNVFELLFQF